mmetsp:Transcript_16697/g.42635  ORF Transcript_16697/g.42635 Transcript_16697/m.42635 type:complete len:223 (+) Transcript_16697:2629-3297(+)
MPAGGLGARGGGGTPVFEPSVGGIVCAEQSPVQLHGNANLSQFDAHVCPGEHRRPVGLQCVRALKAVARQSEVTLRVCGESEFVHRVAPCLSSSFARSHLRRLPPDRSGGGGGDGRGARGDDGGCGVGDRCGGGVQEVHVLVLRPQTRRPQHRRSLRHRLLSVHAREFLGVPARAEQLPPCRRRPERLSDRPLARVAAGSVAPLHSRVPGRPGVSPVGGAAL